MIDHTRGVATGGTQEGGKGLATSSRGYPPGVSVCWIFMIAKDPHPHSIKTLRQKQCLRNSWRCCWCYLRAKSGISGFIPSASASTSIPAGPREQNPGGSSSVSVGDDTYTG